MPGAIVFIIVCSLAAVTAWVYLGVKYGQQGAKPKELDAIEKRLARLEVAIDDLTGELSRVTEGQQFTNKLLESRSVDNVRG